jgi:hypothetical protein
LSFNQAVLPLGVSPTFKINVASSILPTNQNPWSTHKVMKIFLLIVLSLIIICLNTSPAIATTLNKRIQQFPNWIDRPTTKPAKGDLFYPNWLEGKWQVTSTLIEQYAPLAPQITTPGYQENDQYLDRAIEFIVNFPKQQYVISDRAYNGFNIAIAYLGKKAVISVKTDPKNPNRQITKLTENKQLISIVTDRASESIDDRQFIATEITQQIFKNAPEIYLNTVETTTSYRLIDSSKIIANQITAIYLSPKDPNYFKAGDRPVALYRYNLKLAKI